MATEHEKGITTTPQLALTLLGRGNDWLVEQLRNDRTCDCGGCYLCAYRRLSAVVNSHAALVEACKEFMRKCECGEARSTRSYKQMKEALAQAEGVE